jgi:hypothetical protein
VHLFEVVDRHDGLVLWYGYNNRYRKENQAMLRWATRSSVVKNKRKTVRKILTKRLGVWVASRLELEEGVSYSRRKKVRGEKSKSVRWWWEVEEVCPSAE